LRRASSVFEQVVAVLMQLLADFSKSKAIGISDMIGKSFIT
jgi:hypothetical protein